MHGLINVAIQCFVLDRYGQDIWDRTLRRGEIPLTRFEPMLTYDEDLTARLIAALCAVLGRPAADVLEDIGTYLVSYPSTEHLRRLLRFGGSDFLDFLYSLDDLPGRARLAVPTLIMPALDLIAAPGGVYTLKCSNCPPGFGHVVVGLLRTMADDYGALALLEYLGGSNGVELIKITIVETDYAEGRSFDLAARVS